MLPKLLTTDKEDTANYNIIHHFLLNYNVIDMHISDLKLIYGVNLYINIFLNCQLGRLRRTVSTIDSES